MNYARYRSGSPGADGPERFERLYGQLPRRVLSYGEPASLSRVWVWPPPPTPSLGPTHVMFQSPPEMQLTATTRDHVTAAVNDPGHAHSDRQQVDPFRQEVYPVRQEFGTVMQRPNAIRQRIDFVRSADDRELYLERPMVDPARQVFDHVRPGVEPVSQASDSDFGPRQISLDKLIQIVGDNGCQEGIQRDLKEIFVSSSAPSTPSPNSASEDGVATDGDQLSVANLQITPANAQAFLPPDAVVFVANLPRTRSDRSLEAAVQAHFSRYGQCYSKVRREASGMPCAFVQYNNLDECDVAIKRGSGALILGRRCRTEKGRAQRQLQVRHRDGRDILRNDLVEILKILARYGELESYYFYSPEEKEFWRVWDGVNVKFVFFQACQDALKNLRKHDDYKFETSPHVAAINKARNKLEMLKDRNELMAPYVHPGETRTDVFVGNLPLDTTLQDIMDLLRVHGRWTSMCLVNKKCRTPSSVQIKVFAIVHFMSAMSAKRCMWYLTKFPINHGEQTVQVEWKRESNGEQEEYVHVQGDFRTGISRPSHSDETFYQSVINPDVENRFQ